MRRYPAADISVAESGLAGLAGAGIE